MSDSITEVARNDGSINYDSAQVTFEKRARNGLNGVLTYTYSKQIEQWGFNDVQKSDQLEVYEIVEVARTL